MNDDLIKRSVAGVAGGDDGANPPRVESSLDSTIFMTQSRLKSPLEFRATKPNNALGMQASYILISLSIN